MENFIFCEVNVDHLKQLFASYIFEKTSWDITFFSLHFI